MGSRCTVAILSKSVQKPQGAEVLKILTSVCCEMSCGFGGWTCQRLAMRKVCPQTGKCCASRQPHTQHHGDLTRERSRSPATRVHRRMVVRMTLYTFGSLARVLLVEHCCRITRKLVQNKENHLPRPFKRKVISACRCHWKMLAVETPQT